MALWKRQRLLRFESGQIKRTLVEQRVLNEIRANIQPADGTIKDTTELEVMTDHLLLLSKEDLDRNRRYDAAIRRRMDFALAELKRLQERRKGNRLQFAEAGPV